MKTLKPKIAVLDTRRGGPMAVERIRGGRLRVIRERILLRDEYTCQICGRVTADLEVDHVIPLYTGGNNSDSNLQSLCKACHKTKSDEEEKGRGGSNVWRPTG